MPFSRGRIARRGRVQNVVQIARAIDQMAIEEKLAGGTDANGFHGALPVYYAEDLTNPLAADKWAATQSRIPQLWMPCGMSCEPLL